MTNTSSIPEMLGFKSIPFERERKYSIVSYRAQYGLYEDEARKIWNTHETHPEIDRVLSLRYVNDREYHDRINDMCKDITSTPPDEEVRRIMRRLISTMEPPTEEARRQVEEIIGELPEDKEDE